MDTSELRLRFQYPNRLAPAVYKTAMEHGIKHADAHQSMTAYANRMMWSPWERRMHL